MVQTEEGGLDQGGQRAEKWSDSGCSLKIEPRGLADGLGVESRTPQGWGPWGAVSSLGGHG
jgi:hypothetical protein